MMIVSVCCVVLFKFLFTVEDCAPNEQINLYVIPMSKFYFILYIIYLKDSLF